MTTPDYPDWQQPVAVVDQAVEVGGAPINLPHGVQSAVLDCSTGNSLILAVTLPFPEATGVRHLIQVKWAEGLDLSGTDTVTYHSQQSYGNPGLLTWRLPVRGSSFALTHYASNGSAQSVDVYLSTRPVISGAPETRTDFPGALLLNVPTTAVPAGGALGPFYVPPCSRAISARFGSGDTHLSFSIRALGLAAGTVATGLIWDAASGGLNLSLVNMPAPSTALEITLSNNDVAAHSSNVVVWDVS